MSGSPTLPCGCDNLSLKDLAEKFKFRFLHACREEEGRNAGQKCVLEPEDKCISGPPTAYGGIAHGSYFKQGRCYHYFAKEFSFNGNKAYVRLDYFNSDNVIAGLKWAMGHTISVTFVSPDGLRYVIPTEAGIISKGLIDAAFVAACCNQ